MLLVAGILKARDPSWPAAARRFGAPVAVAGALPWAEIALGALLVADAGRPWAAGAAFLLLLAFTVAVTQRVRRGDQAPCACFGTVRSAAPASWRTVARNVVLLAVAAAAMFG